jgi:hypothetical protein
MRVVLKLYSFEVLITEPQHTPFHLYREASKCFLSALPTLMA